MLPRLAVLVLISATAVPLRAQTAEDSLAIRSAALDYIDGWYTGDAARMDRALHSELAKRRVVVEGGRPRLEQQDAMTLVQATRAGYGTAVPQGRHRDDVTILDIFGGAASVRVDAAQWVDYLHLARWDGSWKIVNVLWETRPVGAAWGASGFRDLVEEAWEAVDTLFFDPTFGGVDWDAVRADYLARDYPDRDSAYGAIRAMLGLLGDRATRFLTPEQASAVVSEFSGAPQEGLGLYEVLSVDVEEETGAIVVVTPVPGGPAARAGLRPGDRLLAVDGAPADSLGLAETMSGLRGGPGTAVELTTRRGAKRFDLRIAREQVPAIRAVEGFVRDEGGLEVGYVGLRQFTQDAGERVDSLLDRLEAEGAEAWVLDLRDNPGGYVGAVQAVGALFLGDAPLARLKGRAREPLVLRGSGPPRVRGPVAVLVDEGTASAAEVLASAIQHHRGTLFGARSLGKGLAHGFQALSDGSAVVPTLGRLETLDGRDILERGVEPDVPVSASTFPVLDGAVEVATARDVAYARAVAWLRGRPSGRKDRGGEAAS